MGHQLLILGDLLHSNKHKGILHLGLVNVSHKKIFSPSKYWNQQTEKEKMPAITIKYTNVILVMETKNLG